MFEGAIPGRDRAAEVLQDAASLIVRLEWSDAAGLAHLVDMLQEVGNVPLLPVAVQEPVGRALWKLLDLIDGQVPDPAVALTEVGEWLDHALEPLDDALPPSGDGSWVMGVGGPGEVLESKEDPLPDPPPRSLNPELPVPNAQHPTPMTHHPSDIDRSLLGEFVTECAEYLASAEASLLALETDPDNRDEINTVFRAFHTIKGTAGFLRIGVIGDLAHCAESVLSRMRDGEIPCSGAYADLALRSVDMLKALLGAVSASGADELSIPPDYRELIHELTRIGAAAGQVEVPPPAPPAAAAAPPVAPAPAPLSAAAAALAASLPVPDDNSSAVPRSPSGASSPNPQPLTPNAPPEGSIRIRTDRLDRLIDMVGELVIAQSMVAQDDVVSASSAEDLVRKVTHAGKIIRELQDLSLAMRMVPMRATIQRLARAVRDVARQSGKVCEFVVEGEDTEIDRNMVDAISDPLLHMVRNAVDHGIEPPNEREASGKPPGGTIRFSAYHSGGNVVVELRDDGRGLDRARILQKALDRGLTFGDQTLTDAEVFAFIFTPGFSTAAQVTDLSGRGVGMDVVRSAVEALRGRIEIDSIPGHGTTFTLRLPLTLAITDGMLVRVGAERYIVPTLNIHMSFRPAASALATVAGRGELVMLRDELMPIFRLHHLFEAPDAVVDPTQGLLVVLDDGERRCALLVDELLGQQQVVAKSLGTYVKKVDGVSGGAILGDGQVGLILDPVDLVSLARRIPSHNGNGHSERSALVTNGRDARPGAERRTGGGKFLTFFLEDEEYGLEILKVQEIIGLLPITRVPRLPEFIRGVINLRGKVIPVTDLRLKFGMPAVQPTMETCIVVVRATPTANQAVEVGLIVDKVSEVLDIADGDVDAAPSFGVDVETDYLLGVGKAAGKVKLLLDIDRVLSTQDVVDIRLAAGAAV